MDANMDVAEKLNRLPALSRSDGSSLRSNHREYSVVEMHSQNQPPPAAEVTTPQAHGNGYVHENQNRHAYVPQQGYAQPATSNPARDMNGNMLAHHFGNLSLQTPRTGGNRCPMKDGVPVTPGSSVAGMQRYPPGQYMIVPNGPVFGGVPPNPHYGQFPLRTADQGIGCVPSNFYPNYMTGAPYFPGAASGYPYRQFRNDEYPDHANNFHDSWTAVDENNPGTPAADMAGQPEYYSPHGPVERSPGSPYLCSPPPSQPYLPYQMMKKGGGYVLQDLDALAKQDPEIPRAVPAMWTNPSELTLAKCLENREGITNVYIRGFLPETTDEMLHAYSARFGKIDRCKAIIDLDTGLCKGFGFVQFFSFDSCENCIRGFFHLGYQASFAQKSRNSRLKDLEDRASTNIYCTNVPMEWVEADLRRHFEPYRVVSEKISRDEKTGVSKEVGFARFESREVAEKVLSEFHNVAGKGGVKLLLRFADTKAQKQLKHQSNERRAYRAGEYNYSVEMVQSSTPSPSLHRLQQTASHFSPTSQGSFPSPLGVGQVWTPATSISPPGPMMNKSVNGVRASSWASRRVLSNVDNTPSARGRFSSNPRGSLADDLSAASSTTVLPLSYTTGSKSENSSPRKSAVRAGTTSPMPSKREIMISTPRSAI